MKRAHYSFSDQLRLLIPAGVSLLLVLLGVLPPLISGVRIYPEMVILLACFFVSYYPSAWPLWFAFLIGLLQDLVSGTALGPQALLVMLLTLALRRRAGRMNRQNFRMLWLEVAALATLYLGLLWLIMAWVHQAWMPVFPAIKSAIVTVLWYPPLHLLLQTLLPLLPSMTPRK
jgi:rod shape-determining protein MreD